MSLFHGKLTVSPTQAAAAALGSAATLVTHQAWTGMGTIGTYALAAAMGAAGGVVFLRGSGNQTRKQVINNLHLLCQLDHHDLTEDQMREKLPPLAADNPWFAAFTNVRDRLTEYGQQLETTEQKRAEAEVRLRAFSTERNLYCENLTCLTLPVLTMNHFGEIIFSNTAAKELLELPDEERVSIDRLASPELIRLLKDVRRRNLPFHRHAEVSLGEEGCSKQFNAVCHGMQTSPEESETEHGATVYLEDISELKEIQKRNAQFVSSVSHEMKTPLTSIKAYVELLADGDAEDEETRDEFLGVIDSQADRLQRLIHNLLNLARIEAGVVEVSKEQLSLNEVLEEAFNVVQPSAEQKSIKLVNELSPMYIGILADRDMLQQSAINLLSNAIKYTPDNGKVTLRSRLDEQSAVFEVADTGVGLSPEDQEMIFEKFYRVKKDKNMAPGTGLGLPLAKHIAEDVHGGTLQVTSELGTGSVFTIRIPSAGTHKS